MSVMQEKSHIMGLSEINSTRSFETIESLGRLAKNPMHRRRSVASSLSDCAYTSELRAKMSINHSKKLMLNFTPFASLNESTNSSDSRPKSFDMDTDESRLVNESYQV